MTSPFVITEREIKQFEKTGFHISPVIIPENIIAAARQGVCEFYAGDLDTPLPSYAGIANDTDSATTLRNNEFSTLQKNSLKALGMHDNIIEISAALLRSKTIRLFSDSLITKKPQTMQSKGNVGWHSDKSYWPTCSSNQLITAWIPLQDVSLEMGPLCILESSNLWKQSKELKQYFGFNCPDLDSFEEYLKLRGKPLKKHMMTLKAGQVSFHHSDTIHCSEPNISNHNRCSLTMHFQGDKNHYQTSLDDSGEPVVIGYDRLCKKDNRGQPDYHDPQWFPLLFPKP